MCVYKRQSAQKHGNFGSSVEGRVTLPSPASTWLCLGHIVAACSNYKLAYNDHIQTTTNKRTLAQCLMVSLDTSVTRDIYWHAWPLLAQVTSLSTSCSLL